MPVTLTSVTRRRFLSTSVAAAMGLTILPSDSPAAAARAFDPNRLALLSDIHIAADPTVRQRGVVMYDHLQRVSRELMRLDPRPASVIINGDCAFHSGGAGDYRTLLTVLQPLREDGLTLHLGMGNHDDRERLWKTIPDSHVPPGPPPGRQAIVLDFERADVFLLDSLRQTNHTAGEVGRAQLDWLARALDQRSNKPAIVIVRHHPDLSPLALGLLDTRELLDLLIARRQVKALFYGHTHVWDIAHRSGLHCVNLPAVAYVFAPGQPSGWVDAYLQTNGMTLELRSLDPAHPKHGQKIQLKWRA